MFPEQKAVAQVKEDTKSTLLAMPNVVGVGVGYRTVAQTPTDQLGIIVLVRRKLPVAALSPESLLPQQVDGVKIDVIEVGEIRALQARPGRWRRAPGGVSVGHYKITAGTLGVVVKDRSTGTRLILSNNHVLANSNDAAPGDPILQPGPYDGGSQPNDVIAHLERFCPIEFTTQPGICNLVAAAIAKPVNDGDVKDEILEIGVVQGTVAATLGMAVRKSGRTTGFTTGQITLINATVDVSYGRGRGAPFA